MEMRHSKYLSPSYSWVKCSNISTVYLCNYVTTVLCENGCTKQWVTGLITINTLYTLSIVDLGQGRCHIELYMDENEAIKSRLAVF